MSKNAWLTKNSIPAGRANFVLTLPADEAWRADFLGAFLLLTQEENWEQFETLTPAEMADEWLNLFLAFESELIPMLPPGLVSPYAGSTIPAGWLRCDGSEVSRVTYADLFGAIGTTYGVGDGSTTFELPQLGHKFVLGLHPFVGAWDDLGVIGGEEDHTLTPAEMPAHNHPTRAQFRSGAVVGNAAIQELGDSTSSEASGPATANTGGGAAHNNMPPYLVLNYLIKT